MEIKSRLHIASFSENYISAIKKYGTGLEINHTCISEALNPDKENRRSLMTQIENDISDSCASQLILHGPFTEIIPAGIDSLIRNAGAQRLNQAYEIVKAFDIKKMVVHNGWIPFMYFKSWQAEKGAQFWEAFMADKPDDFNISIENVLEDEPYMMADMMSRIYDERIGLCLDIGHANAKTDKKYSVEKWIEVLGKHITHLHLHNNNGFDDQHRAFGEGTLNMVSIFKAIDEFCPPTATFTIESHDCLSCLEWLEARGYI